MFRPSIVLILLASCSRYDISLCFTSPKHIIPKYRLKQNTNNKLTPSVIAKRHQLNVAFDSRSTTVHNRHILPQIATMTRQSIEHVYDFLTRLLFFFQFRNLNVSDRYNSNEIKKDKENAARRQWRAIPKEIRTKLFVFFSTLTLQKDYIIKQNKKTSIPTTTQSEININRIDTNNTKLTSKIIEQSITSLINNVAMHTKNFKVQSCTSNKLNDLFLQGKINETTITFDRLAFRNLKVSAGGTVIARNVVLAPLSFVSTVIPRYSKPFELIAKDCTLTQDDVMNSSCMRNGLQKLLNLILKRVLLNVDVSETIMTLSVQQVRILGSNKIACKGTGITVLGAPFPFEVHTGIEITDDGHVIRFPNIELVINPGLFEARVPIHKFFPVSVDIGPNAKIESLVIDGKYERLHILAKATIIPSLKKMRHYRDAEEDAVDAKFYCDVGVWLTRVLRFDNSI